MEVEVGVRRSSFIEEQIYVQALRELIINSDDKLLQSTIKFLDDDLDLMFLRCRKYKVPSALKRIKKFAQARKEKYPEFFDITIANYLNHSMDPATPKVLLQRDSQGRQIIIFRLSCWNPYVVTTDEMISMVLLTGFQMFHIKETQENGIIIIIDFSGLSLYHIRQITPARMKKFMYLIANASPLKIVGMHTINAPWIANPLVALLKIFLSPKLRDRVHNHSTMESLHKHVSPEISPTWMGGYLSEDEALDYKIINDLYTDKRNEYYQNKLNF